MEPSRCAQESAPSIFSIRFQAICPLSFVAVVTAASKRITMAKALLVLVIVVAAVAMMIEAADHDKSKSESFSLKILLHNMARDDVTLELLANSEPLQKHIAANMDTVPVVAQTGQSAAIGPFTTASSVVHLSVVVENSGSAPVKKMLAINLLKYFRCGDLSAGGSSMVLTALETWRLKSGKHLVIRLGLGEVVLSFKM